MTSQNVCLICCYSFQEKRSRFISDEAKESFDKFSKELGIPLACSEGREKLHGGSINYGLHLPFGDYITICGDCLCLVVVYVQRRSLQMAKEEELLQLQRAVCKSIKELKSVVEDVQCHINKLHSTVRMGDESELGAFISRRSNKDTKTSVQVRSFREKILSLSTGAEVPKSKNENVSELFAGLPIVIKAEPLDTTEDMNLSDNENNNVNFGDDELADSDYQAMLELGQCQSSIKRNLRIHRRTAVMKADITDTLMEEESWQQDEISGTDLYINEIGNRSEEGDGKSEEEYSEKKLPTKRRYRRRKLRTKKPKIRTLKFGNLLSPGKAAKWKENLFSRVVEQRNHVIATKTDTQPQSKIESVTGKGNNGVSATSYFQVVDGRLQLRGVIVKVHERRRMLECMRCYKMYFEERDVTSSDVQLETLMRNHVLDKHFVVKKKKPVEEMEVIEYTSHTKSKITYKIADKNKYSYTRRCGKTDAGACYYRCDFRKGNCSASLVYKNGKYIRLKKGWSNDGLHVVHAPDVERTNRLIALGNAKYMYLTDDSKTIDEVCSIILNQSGGEEQALPLSKLKRAMVYSKYGSRGMAPEEKMNQTLQCCYCGKIYKEGRGLSRHMRAQHQDLKTRVNSEDDNRHQDRDGKKNPSPENDMRSISRRSSLLNLSASKIQKQLQQNVSSDKQQDITADPSQQPSPASPSCPSIVFNDPSAANKQQASIQQVGVSTTSSVATTPLPNISTSKECPAGNSAAPAPPESSSQPERFTQPSVQNSRSLQSSSFDGVPSNHWHLQSSQQGQQSSSSSPNVSAQQITPGSQHAIGISGGGNGLNPAWQWLGN